jgi:NAD(P)H-dependent flavin oxidoreductase YrpB (nitropropane dioxygenase family)
MLTTRFTELVGIAHPVVQEPMGPHATDQLAAAVSEAGGLGTVSTPGRTPPAQAGGRVLRERIERTAALTDRPFAVNVPLIFAGRELNPLSIAYLRAVLDARSADSRVERGLKVVTTSGGPPGALRDPLRDAGLIHMHKIGSTRQAKKAEALGVDAIIACGYEMGGHTHDIPVHTFVLVPNVTEAVTVPVLLSGGGRDGRSLAAALCMGADGIAMGTRFIATEEHTDWHPAYAQAVVAASEGDDVVVNGRLLRNRFVDRLAGRPTVRTATKVAGRSRWAQRTMERYGESALRRAQRDGDVDGGIVAAGQVAGAINDIVKVAELVPTMADEAARILSGLADAHARAAVRG